MTAGPLARALHALMVRRCLFVSYHHDQDQGYYNAFSAVMAGVYDCVTDRSLDRPCDSDNPEYVMRRIRENHISGTSCTVVLCGAETPWRRYVDWEIRASLDRCHGLLGIILPTASRDLLGRPLVPPRLHDNIVSGFAVWAQWADLGRGALYMKSLIEQAVARPSSLINNSRQTRQRNG